MKYYLLLIGISLCLILSSCEKEPEIEVYTVTWELETSFEEMYLTYSQKCISYYNSEGYIERSEDYSESGELRHTRSYKYDELNRLSEYLNSDFYYYRYEYFGDTLMRKSFYQSSGNLQDYTNFKYDNALIVEARKYKGDGFLLGYNAYVYNNGLLDSILGYPAIWQGGIVNEGEIGAYYLYDYDENDNQSDEIMFSRRNVEDEFEQVYHYYWEFDDSGNVIKRKWQHGEDDPSWSIHLSQYDTKGRKIREDIVDIDGNILGYYNITYSSDEIEYLIPEL